ncbi:MAG: helix-turn-helix domain-containing protein [Alphaproteobacteria bacterium]|nr:helix-turn-helix domain-containing protein [Alphaproteobacteria bacterium]MBQ4130566.1 helix-turn-helix domain-containing protein [Alphaproteobacteria bacterium]MBQ8368147.1 helix-turn-helix domain-containing protein [Alphaproteobacteria bacterium]MBQ8729070.1 helix-turn-helix domain-containing protein [Alphaproteobacteria bacterium]
MAQEEIIFPNNIRNIRLANGMKMTELSRKAGLSLSAVSKIEKGVRRLNQKQLLNICNILGCKLSDIFIKESDDVAGQWQNEIKRRLTDNEDSGLKVFGSGLRKIRQQSGKTIAQAAKDAGMTLSVYHKIEVGQREIYTNEIEPLAKSFAMGAEEMFDKIATLYKSGELNKQISKVKERVKSVLIPGSPMSGMDMHGGLYGAKLYDSARKKLVPVFGVPSGKTIAFKKSDKTMIVSPMTLEGRQGIYAVMPNTKRLGGIIPEKAYLFADSQTPAKVGDLAVFLDVDFDSLTPDTSVVAHVASVRQDAKGNIWGHLVGPEEKITAQTMHKVVMIVME